MEIMAPCGRQSQGEVKLILRPAAGRNRRRVAVRSRCHGAHSATAPRAAPRTSGIAGSKRRLTPTTAAFSAMRSLIDPSQEPLDHVADFTLP